VTVYQGAYDTRWLIVVKAANVADANAAARVVEPDGDTLTVGLRQAGDATNTIVAYWCNWSMPATVSNQVANQMRQALNLSAAQMSIVRPDQRGTYSPPGNWKLVAFDANFATGWPAHEVLAVLGLDVLADVP
jgi:hypothetical protein